jgi:hypothetical protein
MTRLPAQAHTTGHFAIRVNFAVELVLQPFVKNDRVRRQEIVFLAGIEPPASDFMARDQTPVIDQNLNRVGDFQLAAPRRFELVDGVVNLLGKKIYADSARFDLGAFGFLQSMMRFGINLGDAKGRGLARS